MEVKDDLIRVQASDYDESGNKLEPEEKPAERILPVDAPVDMSMSGERVGSLRAAVTVQATAGEFAHALQNVCGGCRHFNNPRWRSFIRRAETSLSKEKLKALNGVRAALLEQGLANLDDNSNPLDQRDIENVLGCLGVCNALTEIRGGDELIVHPESRCPENVITPSMPNGYFQSVSKDSRRITDRAYDMVMGYATGKVGAVARKIFSFLGS